MKRKMASILCALMMALVPVLPARADGLPGNLYMYVETGNSGRLHLRSRPDGGSESLGLYPNGTQVFAADLGNGWSYVLANGLYGCMMTQYLSPDPPYSYTPAAASSVMHQYASAAQPSVFCYPQPTPALYCGGFVTVRNPNSSFVYLRSSKDSDRRDNILAQVSVGTQVTLLEAGRYWSRVRYDGLEGFMVSSYLK